ncbi:hypothetical protein IX308_000209 [Porphyromonas levii]|nr:hypothetical protein [Porphyromonas levii]
MCTFATVKEKNTSPLSKNGEYYIFKHLWFLNERCLFYCDKVVIYLRYGANVVENKWKSKVVLL